MKHNPENERIKRKYFSFLEHAKRQNVASVDAVAKAISRFEQYTKFKSFKAFHFEQAVGFKKHLSKQNNVSTGKPLSKATLNSTLRHLKTFFQWLSQQTGYVSKLTYTDMEYFNLSEKDTRIATAKRIKPVATVEQIIHVLKTMPTNTDIEKRDRAVIAFTLLTGARDSAIASMSLKHVDIVNNQVTQDAREVKTKFSKTFTSNFFPVDEEGYVKQIVVEWVEYLQTQLLFGNDDPLFPQTEIKQNDQQRFVAQGLQKQHWSSANPIRTIFKTAFTNAGLEYFNPHSFRNTLAKLGQKMCTTPEQMKAWSQSLGHEKVMTTLISYGEVSPDREKEVFASLRDKKSSSDGSIRGLEVKLDQLLKVHQAG